MAAGDFSASQIPILKQTAQEAWEASRANNSRALFNPSTVLVEAIMANDITTDFKRIVTTPDNCLGVEIDWMEFTPTVTLDSSFTDHQVVPCDITGAQGESKKATYKLEKNLTTGYMIPEDQCQNLFSYADKYAYNDLQADRALIKALSAHALTRLHSFAGYNVVPESDPNNIGTIEDGEETVTKVNPANMKWQDFYPYLQLVRQFNRFENPFLLDGTAFMHQRFLAAVQNGTLSDNGANAAFQLENYYSDPRTFADAGVTAKIYYIAMGAIAMATGARNPVQAQTYNTDKGPVIRYQAPVAGLTYPNGQPIMKDVFVKQTSVPIAVGSNKCKLYRTFEYQLPFELFLNPKLSTDNVTGVIEFEVDNTVPAKTVA